MVMSGLMLLQFSFVSISSVTNTTYKWLLPCVYPGVSHKPLSSQETFSASLTLVRKVSSVSSGMSV